MDLAKLKDGLLAKGDCFIFGVSLFDLVELVQRQDAELAAARAEAEHLNRVIDVAGYRIQEAREETARAILAARAPAAVEQVDALTDERAAFEVWAKDEGLIQESFGIRSTSSVCDVALKAWQASAVIAAARQAGSVQAQAESQRSIIIGQAVAHCNGAWPVDLSSGIMFFNGQRITLAEFNERAKLAAPAPRSAK